MRCPECGRPIGPRGRWFGQWCSLSCRRRTIRQLRDTALEVTRVAAAIEVPELIDARDALIERFVHAAIPTPAITARTTTSRSAVATIATEDLPMYGDANPRPARHGDRRRRHRR